MCLITFAFQADPRFQFVMAANRDEFYARPTLEAQFWDTDPTILAGKDLEKNGTWLGVTKEGRFGALTNVREMGAITNQKPFQSRGYLVRDFLAEKMTPLLYMKKLSRGSENYEGYNLIFGSFRELYYQSNRVANPKKLSPGYYMLSNAQLNSNWPKARKAKSGLKHVLKEHEDEKDIIEALLQMLRDEERFPDEMLPNTKVGITLERTLSPIFINGENYGTRSSTILLVRKNGHVTFVEKNYGPYGEKISMNTFKWCINGYSK
ncbi:NRDE family protein [Halalkalibacterium ligniniphilum]|uniref:NRDE family protein n=1 Tax=Halalkalibacterium ligniniphilum TaxID=1134413 RepID=UPI00034557E0|nr:NRDE family protein [Halalkalibacterium ligniniphilum]